MCALKRGEEAPITSLERQRSKVCSSILSKWLLTLAQWQYLQQRPYEWALVYICVCVCVCGVLTVGVGVRAYWMCTLIAMLATEWMNGRRTHAVASECVSLSFYQLVSQRSKIENTPNSMLKAHFPCSFTLIGFWIALSRLISLLNEHYAVNQSLSSNTEQNGKDIAKIDIFKMVRKIWMLKSPFILLKIIN